MTDLDFERADKIAHAWREPGRAHWSKCASDLARCYQASRAREARLEALVRRLGKCNAYECEGDSCEVCAGTGLVEAARKELQNG